MSAERETQSCARTVARRFIPVLLLMATVGADARRVAADELSRLEPGAVLHDFEVEALYTNTNPNANSSGNAADRPLGARLVHRPSRFVVDLLRIQSLPQAFLWVNTPAVSDGGEAHTLEHLLLGKGNKARAVAALETMSLASHSAMTQPARTCYHFHTAAGADAFFALFEARLDAMLAPDFTDEEIRREVCNMGVAVEPESGTLAVEERGTVYTEMVSAYERLPTRLYRQLGVVLYGDGHPLALDSGGLPAAIRALEPDDIRRYHETYYHLGNMGAVVALPGDVSVERCLGELSAILARLGAAAAPDGPVAGGDPATFEERLPAPAGAGGGGLHTVRFPDSDPAAPGRIALAWSPRDVQPLGEELLLEIFVDLVASGSTSNLYARLIDSQTRVVDTGARQLYGWVSDQLGRPVQIQLVDVDAERCNAATVDSVRAVIHREITSISRLRSGTPAMEDFNTRARDRVEELRRALIDFLDSPPRFGFRNTDSAWIDHLQRLDGEGGGRRDLSLSAELERIEQMLAGSRNLWRPRIRAWGLLSIVPEAVVATADPALIEEEVTARQQRLDAFVASLLDRYQVDDRQAAISRYAAEVERGTAVLDSMAAAVGMPPFVDSPPLGLDEMLDFEVLALPGGGPLVASRFDNLSTATTGLVLDLRVLDPSQWLFVPALPALLTEVGVLVDGRPLAYNAFRETLRREILELDVELDVDHATGQAELVLRAAGTDSAESHRAIEWLATVLRTPDLRVENLPRIRDAIDEALGRSRGRMRHREESWVQETARGYRSQGHPLLLHAGCFLTQTYDLHRLGWLLQEGGAVAPRVADVLARVADAVRDDDRPTLRRRLQAMRRVVESSETAGTSATIAATAAEATDAGGEAPGTAAAPPLDPALRLTLAGLPADARDLVARALEALQETLSEVQEARPGDDVAALCRQMATDLAAPPDSVLAEIGEALDRLRHRDAARAFLVSNRTDRETLVPAIATLIETFDPAPSSHVEPDRRPLVLERLRQRLPGESPSDRPPRHVALVNESMQTGVHMHTAPGASYADRDREALLDHLACRVYAGHGAHGLFMKTWSAGLAYSNGLGANLAEGTRSYYAERCPDLAETMRFVVGEIAGATVDSTLAAYAVAQVFRANRAAERYEQRGAAMANDLAAGRTPELVRGFRRSLLELGREPELAAALQPRLAAVHAAILPGLARRSPAMAAGASRDATAPGTVTFVIGSTPLLDAWENYLVEVDAGATLQRIYPRDYWDPPPGGPTSD